VFCLLGLMMARGCDISRRRGGARVHDNFVGD
jgi:hypothetical protein